MPDGASLTNRDLGLDRRKPRRWANLPMASFVFAVVLPTVIALFYNFVIASDQYVTEFRCAIRNADPIPLEGPNLLQGFGLTSQASVDSYAVTQFIMSQDMVERLESRIQLKSRFSISDIDWFSRLSASKPAEDVLEYWRSHVDATYETSTGTIIVRVRAFSAVDSERIAREILELSEALVNDLSAKARKDGVRFAEEQVSRAENRLRLAQQAVASFRDKEGVIDPRRSVEGAMGLIGRLKEELAQYQTQLRVVLTYMQPEAPSVRALKLRISSTEREIAKLQAEVTETPESRGTEVLSRVIGGYENVAIEQQLAERFYGFAMEMLQKAQASAERKTVYLAVFVPPNTPEKALAPRRIRETAVVFAVAFALWAGISLALAAVKDHY